MPCVPERVDEAAQQHAPAQRGLNRRAPAAAKQSGRELGQLLRLHHVLCGPLDTEQHALHQGAFGSARVCPGWKWTSYLDPVTSARLIACLIACLAVCLAACRTRLGARLLGAAAWRHIIGPISPALPFRPDRRALEAARQVRPHRSPPALSRARGQRSAGSAARVAVHAFPCGYADKEKRWQRQPD
ncbi:MAG: hypothetical protein ACPIOQ_39105 [Promethearchaeia archaeon]